MSHGDPVSLDYSSGVIFVLLVKRPADDFLEGDFTLFFSTLYITPGDDILKIRLSLKRYAVRVTNKLCR